MTPKPCSHEQEATPRVRDSGPICARAPLPTAPEKWVPCPLTLNASFRDYTLGQRQMTNPKASANALVPTFGTQSI